jgi:hypothetical protein
VPSVPTPGRTVVVVVTSVTGGNVGGIGAVVVVATVEMVGEVVVVPGTVVVDPPAGASVDDVVLVAETVVVDPAAVVVVEFDADVGPGVVDGDVSGGAVVGGVRVVVFVTCASDTTENVDAKPRADQSAAFRLAALRARSEIHACCNRHVPPSAWAAIRAVALYVPSIAVPETRCDTPNATITCSRPDGDTNKSSLAAVVTPSATPERSSVSRADIAIVADVFRTSTADAPIANVRACGRTMSPMPTWVNVTSGACTTRRLPTSSMSTTDATVHVPCSDHRGSDTATENVASSASPALR